ncbi:conserved hypothetical protein [Ricinus communis]|uniref:Uncharacterized protein n=1 Tax=Ricinus communis TaxID=3988 RepID=B9SV27_RICCO|nr:conserved hypothetical protein [Ricinus communis]
MPEHPVAVLMKILNLKQPTVYCRVKVSDINEELISVRKAVRDFLRRKRRRKARDGPVEVPLGEVGHDDGYEDYGKGNKYEGVFAGDEKYYASYMTNAAMKVILKKEKMV